MLSQSSCEYFLHQDKIYIHLLFSPRHHTVLTQLKHNSYITPYKSQHSARITCTQCSLCIYTLTHQNNVTITKCQQACTIYYTKYCVGTHSGRRRRVTWLGIFRLWLWCTHIKLYKTVSTYFLIIITSLDTTSLQKCVWINVSFCLPFY